MWRPDKITHGGENRASGEGGNLLNLVAHCVDEIEETLKHIHGNPLVARGLRHQLVPAIKTSTILALK